jgi:CheY-like chemotaxis protein
VLVAEDSPLNQQVAMKQLEKLGYEADAVSDGTQVLEALGRKTYDVILMDCQMPEMNGYEATWQVREQEEKRAKDSGAQAHIYIVAMTANTEADNRERCEKAGMDDFITKPVQLPQLEAALQRAINDQAGLRAFEEYIDPAIIAALRQLRLPGKADPLVELVDLFLQEAPAQLSAMAKAISSNDCDSMARTISAASSLKGSAINLGARSLAALCDEIEQAARTGWLADAQPVLNKTEKEFARVREALQKIAAAR